jgi:TM2 domain-containing membrane protein YozV/cold shock CspA family protein
MRGTVLGFDAKSGEGKISGDDGARYSFVRGEWHGKTPPNASQKVDFETSGADALAIYPVRGGVGPAASYDRNRIAAALLAIFLGSLGLHKFYMGKSGAGIAMLLISLFGVILAGIPTGLMHLIAVIEGIIYLTMSEEQFDNTYIRGPKAWF